MKESLVQQAQVLVMEHTQQKEETPATLARRLKISAATISNLLNKPDSLSDAMLQQIISALAPKNRFRTVETANHAAVQVMCKEAKTKHRFIALVGYPGAGKSVGLDYFYRNNPNTYLVECNSLMKRRQFFAEILKKMGVAFDGPVYEMAEIIIQQLNRKDSPLLILDEAGKLKPFLLMDLHYIRNSTMWNAGIVLAGPEYFHDNIRTAANKQREGMPELYSRVQTWRYLEAPTKAEIAAICTANGITDAELVKEFQKIKNYRELSNAILNENDESDSGK